MAIGIILTAIVMGFALGGRKATLSDAEIIKRAKTLGMVEQSAQVLAEAQSDSEGSKNDTSSSDPSLAEKGEKISDKDQQEVSLSDTSISEVAPKTQESQTARAEESANAGESNEESEASIVETKVPETTASEASTSEASTSETTTTETASTETATAKTTTSETTTETQTETEPVITGPTKTVTIPGGTSSEGVAAILEREGLVDSATAFNRYLVETGKDRIIRSGTKTFPENATYDEIIEIIIKG
jgi:hypothetical protein